MRRPSHTVMRGAIAGILGALAIAAWFLIIDLIEQQPLRTPLFVGASLLGREPVDASGALLAMYSALHFAVFIGVGIVVAWLLEKSETPPHFLLGLVLGFLLFDLVFYLSRVMTGIDVVTALGWPEVLAGNLIAGIEIGRAHV